VSPQSVLPLAKLSWFPATLSVLEAYRLASPFLCFQQRAVVYTPRFSRQRVDALGFQVPKYLQPSRIATQHLQTFLSGLQHTCNSAPEKINSLSTALRALMSFVSLLTTQVQKPVFSSKLENAWSLPHSNTFPSQSFSLSQGFTSSAPPRSYFISQPFLGFPPSEVFPHSQHLPSPAPYPLGF
jgi:hypothetical protein